MELCATGHGRMGGRRVGALWTPSRGNWSVPPKLPPLPLPLHHSLNEPKARGNMASVVVWASECGRSEDERRWRPGEVLAERALRRVLAEREWDEGGR